MPTQILVENRPTFDSLGLPFENQYHVRLSSEKLSYDNVFTPFFTAILAEEVSPDFPLQPKIHEDILAGKKALETRKTKLNSEFNKLNAIDLTQLAENAMAEIYKKPFLFQEEITILKNDVIGMVVALGDEDFADLLIQNVQKEEDAKAYVRERNVLGFLPDQKIACLPDGMHIAFVKKSDQMDRAIEHEQAEFEERFFFDEAKKRGYGTSLQSHLPKEYDHAMQRVFFSDLGARIQTECIENIGMLGATEEWISSHPKGASFIAVILNRLNEIKITYPDRLEHASLALRTGVRFERTLRYLYNSTEPIQDLLDRVTPAVPRSLYESLNVPKSAIPGRFIDTVRTVGSTLENVYGVDYKVSGDITMNEAWRRGGFGAIYKAATKKGESVIIKELQLDDLPEQYFRSPDVAEMFARYLYFTKHAHIKDPLERIKLVTNEILQRSHNQWFQGAFSYKLEQLTIWSVDEGKAVPFFKTKTNNAGDIISIGIRQFSGPNKTRTFGIRKFNRETGDPIIFINTNELSELYIRLVGNVMKDCAMDYIAKNPTAVRDVDDQVSAFLGEAQINSTLNGIKEVVTFYSLLERSDELGLKHYYLIQEFVNGETLDDWLKKLTFPNDLQKVITTFEKIVDAFLKIHQRTIHKDIKLENIMILPNGDIKIIDFGIAKANYLIDASRRGDRNRTTKLGTLGYEAPEHYGIGETDVRTDLYSLGMLLYYLCTKDTPKNIPTAMGFQPASERQKYVKTKLECRDRVGNLIVPEVWKNMILKLIEPSPAKRYSTAGELLTVIRMLPKTMMYDEAVEEHKTRMLQSFSLTFHDGKGSRELERLLELMRVRATGDPSSIPLLINYISSLRAPIADNLYVGYVPNVLQRLGETLIDDLFIPFIKTGNIPTQSIFTLLNNFLNPDTTSMKDSRILYQKYCESILINIGPKDPFQALDVIHDFAVQTRETSIFPYYAKAIHLLPEAIQKYNMIDSDYFDKIFNFIANTLYWNGSGYVLMVDSYSDVLKKIALNVAYKDILLMHIKRSEKSLDKFYNKDARNLITQTFQEIKDGDYVSQIIVMNP